MDDLIERLEAAASPSFGLDAEIAVASGQFVRERRGKDRQDWFYPVGQAWGRRNSTPYCSAHDRLPRYTASIDAALTLVPDGMAVTLDTRAPAACTIAGQDGWVYAATPALALCAASLKGSTDGT